MRFPEFVSEAADGFDPCAAFSKLLSQRHDMHVDRAIQDGDISPQRSVNDRTARIHEAGMGREKLQETVLGGG